MSHFPAIDVLSNRSATGVAVGYHPIYEFEDVIVACSGGQLLTPRAITRPAWLSALNRGPFKRFFPRYENLSLPPTNNSPAVLIVSAPTPLDLTLLDALPNWRKDYDLVVAFVTDSFVVDWYKWTPAVKQLDALFVPIADDVAPTHRLTGVPTHFVPFGADCLRYAHPQADRWIDVLAYGRQPPPLVAELEHLNSPCGNLVFLRETPGRGSFRGVRDSHYKLLSHTRCALAFDTRDYFRGAYNVSILTPRYAECLAAGCVVLGSKPVDCDRVFNWENAVAEISADAELGRQQILHALRDQQSLNAQSLRNQAAMCAHHDWRHRLAAMLRTLDLPLPTPLRSELTELTERSQMFAPELHAQREFHQSTPVSSSA